jgi:hypothetical protein
MTSFIVPVMDLLNTAFGVSDENALYQRGLKFPVL